MNKRHDIAPHAPTLTRGGGSPYTDEDGNARMLPCVGNPVPFDDLKDRSRGPASLIATRAVRSICGSCPIRPACHADPANEDWVSLLQRPEPPRKPCGTSAAYDWHIRHGEEACGPCKAAAAAKSKARRAKRDKRPVKRAICGTDSGYQGHRRRGEKACKACRTAHTAAEAERLKKRQEAAA